METNYDYTDFLNEGIMSIGDINQSSFGPDQVFASSSDINVVSKKDFKKPSEISTKKEPELCGKQDLFNKMLKMGVCLYGDNVHTYSKDTTTNWKGVRHIFRFVKEDGSVIRKVRYFDKNTGLFYTIEFPLKEGGKAEIRPMGSEERKEFIDFVGQFKDLYKQFLEEGVPKIFPELTLKSLGRLKTTLELMSKSNVRALEKESKPLETEWWAEFQDHPPKVVVFLVGIRDYIHNPQNLDDLWAADVDVHRIHRAFSMKFPKMLQGSETTVLLNHQATKENIEKVFADYKGTLGPLDLFINVVSGHGASDTTLGIEKAETEELSSYFVPSDAKGGKEELDQYIEDNNYLHMIKDTAQDPDKSSKVFIVWDSCHSGGISIKSPTSPHFISKHYHVPEAKDIIYEGQDIIEKAKKILDGFSVQISAVPKDKKMGEIELNNEEKSILEAHGLLLEGDRASGHALAMIFAIIGAPGYASADPDGDGIITAESLFKATYKNQMRILPNHSDEIREWQYLGTELGYPSPQKGDYYKTPGHYPEEMIIGADRSPEEIARLQKEKNEWEKIRREVEEKCPECILPED